MSKGIGYLIVIFLGILRLFKYLFRIIWLQLYLFDGLIKVFSLDVSLLHFVERYF